ncbi:MAG: AMP-binding protein [Proteobacteria bacterium]|nr:AMP-binding protein [Pseudomonadota bacterium]
MTAFFERARSDPNGTAVDDFTRRRTWAELADRSRRVARFLRDEAGLRPDDHAAFLLSNRVEAIELVLGAVLAGVWITPINWHLAADEIAYVLEDSGARVLFGDPAHRPLLDAALAGRGGIECVLAGEPLDRALAAASDAPLDPSGPAGGNMIYTSGTTGRPKGVKRTRPASVAAALEHMGALGRNIGLDGSGPHLVTGPLYHAAPLMFAIYDAAGGAPVLIQERFRERETLALLEEHEVAHTHLVPTMFVRLLALPEEERAAFDPSGLRLVLHGAAPISVPVKQRMIDWWGPVLVEYWGGTEGGVNTLIGSEEWLAHPGSVGRALPAFEVFALGGDGQRLPNGEAGALHCRHHHQERVFEYHRDAEKTARAHPEPGVFTLGDVGRVDAEGYVHLLDRQSNMIISGGVNIYPVEIEQVLQEHPAVADVAVFGVPDDEWGESVKAAVELAPGETASDALERDLLTFAGRRLAKFKLPRSVDFEAELPRHPTGKLHVRRLRDRYWADRERNI